MSEASQLLAVTSCLVALSACAPHPHRVPVDMVPIEPSAPPAFEPVAERPKPSTEPPPVREASPEALHCAAAGTTHERLELAVGETKTLRPPFTKIAVVDDARVEARPADHHLVLRGLKVGGTQVWARREGGHCEVFDVTVYSRPVGLLAPPDAAALVRAGRGWMWTLRRWQRV